MCASIAQIDNQESLTQFLRYVGVELLGQLKTYFPCNWPVDELWGCEEGYLLSLIDLKVKIIETTFLRNFPFFFLAPASSD